MLGGDPLGERYGDDRRPLTKEELTEIGTRPKSVDCTFDDLIDEKKIVAKNGEKQRRRTVPVQDRDPTFRIAYRISITEADDVSLSVLADIDGVTRKLARFDLSGEHEWRYSRKTAVHTVGGPHIHMITEYGESHNMKDDWFAIGYDMATLEDAMRCL